MVRIGETYLSYDYGPDFYQEVTNGAVMSAQTVVPYILETIITPETVIDIGCGAGAWAREFANAGAHVLGLDGEWAKPNLLIPEANFKATDLAWHLSLVAHPYNKWDLAICLEVAEHLPFERGPSLVKDLCALSNTILFSGATPGQGGHGHINEQPHTYWHELFNKEGYLFDPILQAQFKDNPSVCWWYSQNMFIYTKVA